MRQTVCTSFIIVALMSGTCQIAAESIPFWGRVTLFGTMQQSTFDDGSTRDYSEVSGSISLRSAIDEDGGLEYGVDVRGTTYPSSTEKDNTTNVYDAWVGGRTSSGLFSFRVGQMWIDDLGSMGSVGGVMAQVAMPQPTAIGRFRFGVFGGLEPEAFDAGYVADVKKAGAWLALDGDGNRRHVLGYVQIRDADLVERSVVTMTNFIPAGHTLFLYQAAEYDLAGPGGIGEGGLNYFFMNARYLPSRRVEVMGSYHRGLSIDARSITQDILNGRPVDQRALEGFLYESIGGRLTVEVWRNVRVYAGYASDRNNSQDAASGRVTAGIWATNLLNSGLDVTISDNRIDRADGGYDSWYASIGRNLGSKVYVSVDYATSLSFISVEDGSTATIETRPRTQRYSLNGSWNVNRWFSLLLTFDQFLDDAATENRGMLGLSFRF